MHFLNKTLMCSDLLRTKVLLYITKKTPSLQNYEIPKFQDFKKILSNTFIHETIMIKIYMNANSIDLQSH